MARSVGNLRHVQAPFSPPCRLITSRALSQEIERKLRRDLPVDLELFVEALVRFGLVEGDAKAIVPRLLDFYRGQVLGFYEPSADEMVIVEGGVGGEATTPLVWAHELEHAAQEHRFKLPSRLLELGGNGDAQRAASAIAEGDALLVMFLLAAPAVPGVDTLSLAEAAMSNEVASQLASFDVPAYFVEDLLFPYTKGFAVVVRAYREGGWDAVDRLLTEPPQSTAELLHPDRPRVDAHLADADLPPLPPGHEEVLTDTIGEWGLATWLARRLPRPRADSLAATWRGDRLRLSRSRAEPNDWAVALKIRCADVGGCARLREALQEHAVALLARLTRRPATLVWSTSGVEIELRAGWPAAWSSPPQARAAAPLSGS